jgi:hypothetical protein
MQHPVSMCFSELFNDYRDMEYTDMSADLFNDIDTFGWGII